MYEIVLIRHGESQYNVQNLFTGWSDPDLTEKGIQEAKAAGKLLKDEGYTFDLAFYRYSNDRSKHLTMFLMKWICCGFLCRSPGS